MTAPPGGDEESRPLRANDERAVPILLRTFNIAVAGVICGFLAIVVTVGHAGLVFVGDLRGYLPLAIGLALFSTLVASLLSATFSKEPAAGSPAQDIPAVALSSAVSAVGAAMPASLPEPARIATFVAAIALATALSGLSALLLGYFRSGNIVRFVPYPVVGGFLAGTGWLILTGGVSLVLSRPVDLSLLSDPPARSALVQAGATAAFVLALVFAQRRFPGALSMPVVIIASVAAFQVIALLLGESPSSLRAAGWLIALPESGRLWPPLAPADLALIDWRAVAAGLYGLPAVVVLTIIAFLMNATGVELESDAETDLDRELEVSGAGNIAASFGGGLPAYMALFLALFSARLGAQSRLVGVIVAALTLTAMIFGGILLDAVPALVLGGVLVWVGGGLMIEWLVLARRRMRPAEHAIVILIFASVVFIDFAVGVVVGLVAAMLLFAIEYGRVDVVRHELTGADFQSSLNAAEERRALLRRHGGAILILRLQGFLFFGTADMLRRRVQERVLAGSLRFLVVDFRRVGGIDSSALQSFSRLVRIARARNVEIVLTGLSRPMQAAVAAGFADRDLPRIEPDIEHGLKWCEDALLAPLRPDAADAAPTALEAMLDALTGSASIAGLIVPYWRRTLEGAGATVIAQGTACDDIFIVESGNASVVMEVPGDEPIRLAGVGPGAVIGEGAFYLREPRSASIVADGPLVVWRFTRDDLARLAEEAPAAAAAFHAGMATMLARRLIATNRLVRLLAD